MVEDKERTIEKIMMQLGYLKLIELSKECGKSQIDVYTPGLDGINEYMTIVTKDNARLCLVNEDTGEIEIVTDIEL